MIMAMLPMVIENIEGVEKAYDPYSRLLKERIIMVEGEVTTSMANAVIAQLLLLEQQDPDADITMYINSPGGDITAGLGITDTMDFIKCDVNTVGVGLQASMGSFILASGTPGKRMALKRSSIMIHRLSGGTSGDYHNMESDWKHMAKLHEQMTEDYARLSSGKVSKEKFEELMRYNNWLSLDEAIEYGLIDKIINTRKELEEELANGKSKEE